MGVAWGQSNWTGGPGVSGSTNLFAPIDTFDEGGSFFFGLQGGYNYVLPNRVLLGAEVDASFSELSNPLWHLDWRHLKFYLTDAWCRQL
jgi:hypothetical protein